MCECPHSSRPLTYDDLFVRFSERRRNWVAVSRKNGKYAGWAREISLATVWPTLGHYASQGTFLTGRQGRKLTGGW